jgi:hypothetical protein
MAYLNKVIYLTAITYNGRAEFSTVYTGISTNLYSVANDDITDLRDFCQSLLWAWPEAKTVGANNGIRMYDAV